LAAANGNSEPIVAINVTPFVDVALVLLIIFMATSSYVVNPAIEVSLPEAASGGDAVETTLALVLAADNTLYLNGQATNAERVADYCRVSSAKNPKLQASVAADGAAKHAQVVQLIDLLKLNGVHSFALNVERPKALGAE
jgi:biopolymer transport protein ExbD